MFSGPFKMQNLDLRLGSKVVVAVARLQLEDLLGFLLLFSGAAQRGEVECAGN